jgi:hypothetical protein
MCTVPLPPGVNPIAVDKCININIQDSAVLNLKCLCRTAISFCIPEGLPVAAVEKDVLIEF